MKFTPKTEEEIAEDGILSPGIYPFEVIKSVDSQSKSGADMIELSLRVFGSNNDAYLIRDWLVEKMAHKLRHAAVTLGLQAEYESGNLSAVDFARKEGLVKVGIQKGKAIPDKPGENYPDRNSIVDYVDDPSKAATAAPVEDDDIPF